MPIFAQTILSYMDIRRGCGYGKAVFESAYNRRSRSIDYAAPGIYHIILRKHPSAQEYGSLAGDPAIAPGLPGCAKVERSSLGRILQKEIYDWPLHCTALKVYQYVVMPDHAHILIRVTKRLPHPLGTYIGLLKGAITRRWRASAGDPAAVVFEEGYTDRYLHPGRDLDTLFRYIRENPHRLAMRRRYPEFFSTRRDIELFGSRWSAYGNLFLLRDPMKCAVAVRTRHTPAEREAFREEWLWNAANGGVLVSPFISPEEKAIREEAERLGGRIIHIQHQPFGKRFKPEERRFNLCSQGRMLILAPAEPLRVERFRNACLLMNRVAERLAYGPRLIL